MLSFISIMLLNSCGNSIDKKIEELSTISEDDIRTLDSLFHQFDPIQFPIIDNNDCRQVAIIERKINYIKDLKPSITKIYYQELVDNCNKIDPDVINIFLETSASMRGYYACPVFTGASSIRIPDYGGQEKINCYLYDNNLSNRMSYATFSEQLSRNQIKTGESSMFNQMFKRIIELTPKNTLSFFITDAIIAAENSAIIDESSAGLMRIYQNILYNLQDTIREAKKNNPDFAISVYRFIGTFNGIYYDSNNGRHILTNVQRPFFVFVFGDKRITDDFKRKVNAGNELQNFKPTQQIHFNGGGAPSFNFTSNQIGTDDRKVQKGIINTGDPVLLRVALWNFPDYILNSEYLNDYCQVKNGFGLPLSKESVGDRNFNLRFPIADLSSTNKVTVTIDMTHLPEWCSEFSTRDDKSITTKVKNQPVVCAECLSQTFYIEDFMQAIRAGTTSQATIEGVYEFTK